MYRKCKQLPLLYGKLLSIPSLGTSSKTMSFLNPLGEKVESVAELIAIPANLNGDKACVLFNLPDVFLRNKTCVM